MSKKLIIGYLLDDTLDVTDGVQQAMISIAEKMRAKGHDVHYIVTKTKRSDLENVQSLTNYWSVKFNGNSVRTPKPISKSKVKNLFSKNKFDVLHVQAPYSPYFTGRIIKKAPKNTRVFSTFHILPYNKMSTVGTKLLSKSLSKQNSRIDVAFAVSEPALEFMKNSFGLDGTVLPNPVDYEFYQTAKPKKSDKFTIVFVGRFEHRKGVENLVKAYHSLDKKIRDKTQLIMCGKGPLLNKLKKYSTDKNLKITFTGFVSEELKAQYLAGANIAIFPSISGESFGIVLTEAMSAGSEIVLAGNNPGYASVMVNFEEALFDGSKPHEIAKKIEKAYKNNSWRKQIGSKQKQEVKQYDIKSVVTELEKHYLKACEK